MGLCVKVDYDRLTSLDAKFEGTAGAVDGHYRYNFWYVIGSIPVTIPGFSEEGTSFCVRRKRYLVRA